jgi:hypothetical protein
MLSIGFLYMGKFLQPKTFTKEGFLDPHSARFVKWKWKQFNIFFMNVPSLNKFGNYSMHLFHIGIRLNPTRWICMSIGSTDMLASLNKNRFWKALGNKSLSSFVGSYG